MRGKGWIPLTICRTKLAWAIRETRQPTMRRSNASMSGELLGSTTKATQRKPDPGAFAARNAEVARWVKSATQSMFGAGARNWRLTWSSGQGAAMPCARHGLGSSSQTRAGPRPPAPLLARAGSSAGSARRAAWARQVDGAISRKPAANAARFGGIPLALPHPAPERLARTAELGSDVGASRSEVARANGLPPRPTLALPVLHRPHCALAQLRRKLLGCLLRHGSVLSQVGASGKPGAVHRQRLVRRQRVGDVAEVDAAYGLLGRHVGKHLPQRLALDLGP